MLAAGDTKMKQVFLLVGLILPLEALSVVALWRKAKSGEVPPAPYGHLAVNGALVARWVQVWLVG